MSLARNKNLPKLLLLLSSVLLYLVIDAPLKVEQIHEHIHDAQPLQESQQQLQQPLIDATASPIDQSISEESQQQLQQPLIDATTLTPSPIDQTISERLTWENEDKCDRVFLFMPYFFSGHGQGFQINCYLMAALMAAFMDMALVVLEPPHKLNRFDTWSQVSIYYIMTCLA
jgi:hypothetical protein